MIFFAPTARRAYGAAPYGRVFGVAQIFEVPLFFRLPLKTVHEAVAYSVASNLNLACAEWIGCELNLARCECTCEAGLQ